jgi:hypothetical protein
MAKAVIPTRFSVTRSLRAFAGRLIWPGTSAAVQSGLRQGYEKTVDAFWSLNFFLIWFSKSIPKPVTP